MQHRLIPCCGTVVTFINDNQSIAEALKRFEMFRAADCLNTRYRNRSAILMSSRSHLADDGQRVCQQKFVRRLLKQFLTVSDDQRIHHQATGNLGEHNGFASTGGKNDERPSALWLFIEPCQDSIDTGFLIRTQGEGRWKRRWDSNRGIRARHDGMNLLSVSGQQGRYRQQIQETPM